MLALCTKDAPADARKCVRLYQARRTYIAVSTAVILLMVGGFGSLVVITASPEARKDAQPTIWALLIALLLFLVFNYLAYWYQPVRKYSQYKSKGWVVEVESPDIARLRHILRRAMSNVEKAAITDATTMATARRNGIDSIIVELVQRGAAPSVIVAELEALMKRDTAT